MATASNGGVTATYTYNALGQRIQRTASSGTTLYLYDEAGHLAGEYTSTGALIQETVWLGDIPVATLRPNGSGGVTLFYVHADHLNTPRLVTDTSNNIRWRWDSDPFGTNAPDENPSNLGVFSYSLRFPGQQYDAVVGLHYNYFRDYDPATGRYVESDPIGLRGGLNPFRYVRARPTSRYDRFGLEDSVPGKIPSDEDVTDLAKPPEDPGQISNPDYKSWSTEKSKAFMPKDPLDRYANACLEEEYRKDDEAAAVDALLRKDDVEYNRLMKSANEHLKRWMRFLYGVTSSERLMPPSVSPTPSAPSPSEAPKIDLPMPELKF